MDYIKDKDGNLFIAINNKNNKFCYHIVVVQYLHSSKTLNECLRKFTRTNSELINNVIWPSYTYSKIDESNYKEIYKQLQHVYDLMVDNIVDDFAKDGYYPEVLMFQVILPVIYHLYPNKFENICRELHIKKLRFTTMSYKIDELINKSPFVKSEFRKELYNLNMDMINNLSKINLENNYDFKCAILEVFPHIYDCDDGHALFILKTDNYYIFDDSNFISSFNEYVKDREFHIHKLTVRNIDEKTINDLSKLWGKDILHKKINDRYELINEYEKHTKDMNMIGSNIIILSNKNKMETVSDVITGGDVETTKKSISWWMIVSIVLIVVLIIESIFAVLNYLDEKEPQSFKVKPKCPYCP